MLYFTENRKNVATINASLESSISGIRVTKAFTNKDNLYVNAFSKDLLNAMSVRKVDRDFDSKMPI